jgi:putative transposase
MAEKALTAVIQEVRAGRLNPLGRRPDAGDGMSGISNSPVSRPCGEIDEGEGLPRSSNRGRLAISVDRCHPCEGALNGRIVSVAVIIAIGLNSDSRREVLGMILGRQKPRHSGRRSCANRRGAGSSW